MSAGSAVLAGRVLAEAQMVDACIVDRFTAEVLDENTGQMTPTFEPVYEGKCRVQRARAAGTTPDAGEHQFVLLNHVVQLPVDATVYRVRDRIRVTASELDPAMVGRVFTVSFLIHKSHLTSRRLICEEVIA